MLRKKKKVLRPRRMSGSGLWYFLEKSSDLLMLRKCSLVKNHHLFKPNQHGLKATRLFHTDHMRAPVICFSAQLNVLKHAKHWISNADIIKTVSFPLFIPCQIQPTVSSRHFRYWMCDITHVNNCGGCSKCEAWQSGLTVPSWAWCWCLQGQ